MSVKIDRSSVHELPDSGGQVCVSYAPGHNVHWIQALRSANDKAVSAKTWPGKVVSVEGEVVTVLKRDDSLVRFRVHDPAGLVALLQRRGKKVTVNDQYCIMRAGITRAGSSCISVQPDEPLGPLNPCRALVRRIRRMGNQPPRAHPRKGAKLDDCEDPNCDPVSNRVSPTGILEVEPAQDGDVSEFFPNPRSCTPTAPCCWTRLMMMAASRTVMT